MKTNPLETTTNPTAMTEQHPASLKTQPPWQQDGSKVAIPPEYTIVAELPCITWGWERDLYYWILKDQSGALVLGASVDGGFYIANADALREQINALSGYIEATKSALQLLESP